MTAMLLLIMGIIIVGDNELFSPGCCVLVQKLYNSAIVRLGFPYHPKFLLFNDCVLYWRTGGAFQPKLKISFKKTLKM